MKKIILIIIFITTNKFLAQGHDLQHTINNVSQGVVITFFYQPENPFSFESYEVYSPEQKIPFQVGRTDQLGRLVFLPNLPGLWKIKTFSDDGHGINFTIKVDQNQIMKIITQTTFNNYTKILIGLSILFGLFGVIVLWRDFFNSKKYLNNKKRKIYEN